MELHEDACPLLVSPGDRWLRRVCEGVDWPRRKWEEPGEGRPLAWGLGPRKMKMEKGLVGWGEEIMGETES